MKQVLALVLHTAGLIYGGNLNPGRAVITESYNGTAWTELT